MLLAYYIAAINIETVFHAIADRDDYLPFEGICLTDSFALHESDDLLSDYMKDNSDRRERQKKTDIRVIVGNPPYSVGQRSANDNAQNVAYAGLDERVRATYGVRGDKNTKKKALYDSYIRAIRWGSDRLGDAGVMAYVTNAGWLDGIAMDGLRKCLSTEFTRVYVFHLRGNAYTAGERRRKEKDNVFGVGTRTPVAIAVFVKDSQASEQCRILFHDIGDYLDRKEKLDIINRFRSVRGIKKSGAWTRITPDEHGDWLDQRDTSFDAFPVLGDKKHASGKVLFENCSRGIVTSRDAWCVNTSRKALIENIESTVAFYNAEMERWARAVEAGKTLSDVKSFVNLDPKRISWGDDFYRRVKKEESLRVDNAYVVPCLYRPFTKQNLYYSPQLNWSLYQMPQIFPHAGHPNRMIAMTGTGGRSGFSVLMMDSLAEYQTLANGLSFPFWLYDEAALDAQPDMLSGVENQPIVQRRDAITEYAQSLFSQAYPTDTISRQDIFHYIYGLLHSEDYRQRFRANLSKELPRIPCVKSVEDYRAFRDAGQRLGELHVGYESVEPWPVTIDAGNKELPTDPEVAYRVTKMRHPGTGKNKDRSTVIYNPYITIRDIPDGAYDYFVSGKPALQWVMERQCVKTDKASGIVSDANRYAIETVGDPRYPLDLFLRVITVSLETVKIVRALPELSIE